MWLDEVGITHKVLPDLRIASIKTEVKDRGELKALFEEVKAACGKAVSGEPLLLWYTGTGLKGMLVEAAYPVSRTVRRGRVSTRELAGGPAYTALHRGPIDGIDITAHRRYVGKLYAQGIVLLGPLREVYLAQDPARPEDDLTELQYLSHEWTCRLARGIEAALGPGAEGLVMQGVQALGPASTKEDRYAWVKSAMERLDAATRDEGKKYLSVSGCADDFPPNRLEHLREVYLRRRSVDDVLEDMLGDNFWYAGPVRKGAVVYETKLPVDEEAHKRAKTREERRKAYCHCVLLNHFINDGDVSPTYCYCGAGWYRQLWEAITGAPVHIEAVRLLTRGDEECTFAVHLDPEAVRVDLAKDARKGERKRTKGKRLTKSKGKAQSKRGKGKVAAARPRRGAAKARPKARKARKTPKRARARKRAR
jgi:hypothetical protein